MRKVGIRQTDRQLTNKYHYDWTNIVLPFFFAASLECFVLTYINTTPMPIKASIPSTIPVIAPAGSET